MGFKNISHYILDLQNAENQSIKKIESFIWFCGTDASYFDGNLCSWLHQKSQSYLMIFEKNSEGFSLINLKKIQIGFCFYSWTS
jgi:hypothetical protein